MKKIKLTSRDAIIEAAFNTFNRMPGASLADVAENAGVGRATLHRHFSSRQELMVALAEIAQSELRTAVNTATSGAQSYSEALELSFSAIIPLAGRQWFLSHEAIDDDHPVSTAYHQDIVDLHAAIDAAKAEGSIAADLPTKWIAATYENLIYAAWMMVREEELTPAQAMSMAWRSFMKGVSQ